MISKILDWLVNKAEGRARKKLGGIPIAWIIYKPEKPPPNVIIHTHYTVEHDEWLQERFKEIADYIRENWRGQK